MDTFGNAGDAGDRPLLENVTASPPQPQPQAAMKAQSTEPTSRSSSNENSLSLPSFPNETGGRKDNSYNHNASDLHLHRNISNQSTIDSALSRNSHLDMSDPNLLRMFGVSASNSAERQRRLRLLIDQCETVRFPFKKRLILANMDLSQDEIPVEQICSKKLGAALYKLSLSGNRLKSIPESLTVKLMGLRALDVSQCDLRSLPEKWDLPHLKKLNLSHNLLETSLPEGVCLGLPDLQHLDLYGNKLTSLCPRKQQCGEKQETGPESCRVSHLLSKLEYLDVGYNRLTEIPPSLANLPSLKILKLMNNAIEIIPAPICEKPELRVLDISSNPLVQPPLETCKRGLHSMRRYYHCLKLEETADTDVPPPNSQNKTLFQKMSKVKMRGRSTSSFAGRGMCRTTMFRTSSEPQSVMAESAATVRQGEEGPPIRSVSFSLGKKGAPGVNRHISDSSTDTKNSMLNSDDSAVDSGLDHTDTQNPQLVGLNNAEMMPHEITVNDTLKVIFVGMALTGKTSIIKRLIEGKNAKTPNKDERTIGVDIYEWDPKSFEGSAEGSLQTQIPIDGGGDVDVKFSVWDFAGQHVYHATHELFFSSQALYVLVWDMGANNPDTAKRRSSINEEQGAFKLTYDSSDEEDDFFDSEQESRRALRALEQDIDEKLQFWIDCINYASPGAAILPVASFNDCFSDGGKQMEAIARCRVMRERLRKHEERRVRSMKQRLKEYDSKFGASSEMSVRLRHLLCDFNRPKIIFGPPGPDSVVRVSSKEFSGFDTLAERIVNVSTGRERGGWDYPIFRGHLGARIPRMRLKVRDAVRSMRERFKVVEWNYFLDELKKLNIDVASGRGHDVADVSDALHFLASIGELSYFGSLAKKNRPVKLSSDLYDDVRPELEYDEDEATMSSPPFSQKNVEVSIALSDFIFLNPRWLVATVACILRHDLTTEIYEVRRAMRNLDALEGSDSVSTRSFERELKTDVNMPVITARDAMLLWESKRFTKKGVERALQYAKKNVVSPYEFLQKLLVRFGVFVPIDLSIDRTLLGGRDYSGYSEYSGYPSLASDNAAEVVSQAPNFFFLPSLLGPGEPNIADVWTYKTSESWKTTICHTALFPDGVPPSLMERLTASILSDLYSNTSEQLHVKEILCWRSAFYLKIGNHKGNIASTNENIVEIFSTLVDKDSPLCVASDTMGVGMRKLIMSAKGLAGDYGSNIWNGGYKRVLTRIGAHLIREYSGLEFERYTVCPQCLAKRPISQAGIWERTILERLCASGEYAIRCRYGHLIDARVTSLPFYGSLSVQELTEPLPRGDHDRSNDIAVSDLLKAVVIVGVWDEKLQRVVRAGSGFIADKKRGFIVTAGHTLMDRKTWREVKGKIVIGIVPSNSSRADPIAVYRYFARIVAKDPKINEDGICKLDACVLQITTRMENDVLESGKGIGEQPETLLMNNPALMKREMLSQLNVSQKFELDEAVRILGFNQGGEGLIGPGEELNRCADFARGYVVMKFALYENSEQALNRNFRPNSEIVVICPTIGGHSGGPCVNNAGEVIGILSRADPADRQRCYLVPTSEWQPLLNVAKRLLVSSATHQSSSILQSCSILPPQAE